MVFIATSLDGYIATEDDSLDWLYKVDGEGDNGYLKFYDTIDTVILGRRTYDWIMNIEGEFPYKNKDCYVFTSSKQEPSDYVTFVDDNVVELINRLKDIEGKNIWIVGGGAVLTGIITLGGGWWLRRKNKRQKKETENGKPKS